MSATIFNLSTSVVLTASLLWIATVDFRTRRIPDIATLPLIAAGLALAGQAGSAGLADRLIGAGAGFLVLWAIGEAFFRLRGFEGLGIGDAKLFSAAGAWLGWQQLPVVLLLACVMGLAYAALTRTRELAFGPWLAGAFALMWLYGLRV